MPKIISASDQKDQNTKEVGDMLKSYRKEEEENESIEDSLESQKSVEDEQEEPEIQEPSDSHEESEQEEEQDPPKQKLEEEDDDVDEVNEQLRMRIAELETGKAFEAPEKNDSQQVEQQPAKSQEQGQQIEKFVTAEEFEEMQTNPEKVNEIMTRVYQRAREDTIRDIPNIVEQTTARQISMQDAVKKFYTENPELRQYAQYVGYVANQVRSESPDLGWDGVLGETASRVKKNLAISSQAKETEEQRRKKQQDKKESAPAFAKQGSGNHKGGKSDDRSGFAKEVDSMIESLNR
jgi:hypothetical protein